MVFTPPLPLVTDLPLDLTQPWAAIAPHSAEAAKLQPVKIAILGAGHGGTNLLQNFVQHPQAQVVAVADPCIDRLDAVSAQFLLDQAKLTENWAEAINLPGLAAVAIATPTVTHYPLIRAALQQGLHVLAANPLALEAAEALELCHLAAQQQKQLVVNHTYLFHPAVQRGKTLLQQVGHPCYGHATRTYLGPVRNDVNALWDLAIHDIAIFNHWLDAVPLQVQAQGKTWLQAESAHAQRVPQGLSDLVWVKLLYPSGFQVSIHLYRANPDQQRRLCVVGSQGTLIFDELAADAPLTLLEGRRVQGQITQQRFSPLDQQRQVFSLGSIDPLPQVCDHFLTCVRENQLSDLASGWLGAELVQILSALTQSLNQEGQPVNLRLA